MRLRWIGLGLAVAALGAAPALPQSGASTLSRWVHAGFAAFQSTGPTGNYEPPATPFDPARSPPPPNYASRTEWVALPDSRDPADDTPPGVLPVNQARAKVGVFFLYPTVFTSDQEWNADTRDADLNARIAGTTIRNQASVFNGCCAIYAPRYRQMTLGGYVKWSENSVRATELAYSDVSRAFRQFLVWNKGRPFILAGHSQGSRQGKLLIEREIDGKPLARRMVAAYLLGNWLESDWFAKLRDVHPCTRAGDTGCVVGWSTYGEGRNAALQRVFVGRQSGFAPEPPGRRFHCINPLSWSTGPEIAVRTLDKGAWLHGGGTTPRPIEPAMVSARCDDGALYISQPAKAFADLVIPIGNYHNVDYNIAYMNLRENASVRATAFLRANGSRGGGKAL
ncbi:DUF3089 domain-containing protein [Sphingomonas immobilis]|uniref:DUF3089 domain-containing protein n=1 Tax=Sphingomonas immobilis TaxID=3063997 RepID=A0ABT9A281_9SPHN|nr:DUF3089 domain-containing protein [Sphingomonas sp. CA1-15]MDO7843944.1 DUF3089 domain-containing protein [Sphingomonas sp. CA1-15]